MGGNFSVWVRCPNCGHKLFSIRERGEGTKIEIKCSSCKDIVSVYMGDGKYVKTESEGSTSAPVWLDVYLHGDGGKTKEGD